VTRQAVHELVATLLAHYAEDVAPNRDEQAAVDYVAGMTDRFALRCFEDLVGVPAARISVLG
jgi:dGTP triphosphohydrolase